MSEDLSKPKKAHKDPRKKVSQTEIYRLPKEIFVVQDSITQAKAYSKSADKKPMREVVVIKDESRHEDDCNDFGEGAAHGRRTHPKSPRPSYRGKKFTFEGLSSVGTKSAQSDIEEATESYKPLIFVQKISLVQEENSTIESINSKGYQQDFTPMSCTGEDGDKLRGYNFDFMQSTPKLFNVSSSRARDDLSGLPTPHASNSALSGEKPGGSKSNIENSTPLSSSIFLNPFPFDEATTVQAGRHGPRKYVHHCLATNQSLRKMSSDDEDPDWYIEFQIKNGIIAENSGPDDDSVGDCHATFKEICGLSSHPRQHRDIPNSPSEALSDRFKETGLITSYHEATNVEINHSDKDPVLVSRKENESNQQDAKNDSEDSVVAFPVILLDGRSNDPPSTIEVLIRGNTSSNDLQKVLEPGVVSEEADEHESPIDECKINADAQSHQTGPSDLTSSSQSLETYHFKLGTALTSAWPAGKFQGFQSAPLQSAPSDEMFAKSLNAEAEPSLGRLIDAYVEAEANKKALRSALERNNKPPPAVKTTVQPKELPKQSETRSPSGDGNFGYRRRLTRKLFLQDTSFGQHSQAYLRSSTYETAVKVRQRRDKLETVKRHAENLDEHSGVSTTEDANNDWSDLGKISTPINSNCVRPVTKDSNRPIKVSVSPLYHDVLPKHVSTNSFTPRPTDSPVSSTTQDVHCPRNASVNSFTKEIHRPMNATTHTACMGTQDQNDAVYPSVAVSMFGRGKIYETPIVGTSSPNNAAHDGIDESMLNTASLSDCEDTRTITPAPSDEMEQHNISNIEASIYSRRELPPPPESTSRIFACDIEIGSLTSMPTTPPDETDYEEDDDEDPEVAADGMTEKLPFGDHDIIVSFPTDDVSIVLREGRDDVDEKTNRNEEQAWMEAINTAVCPK